MSEPKSVKKIGREPVLAYVAPEPPVAPLTPTEKLMAIIKANTMCNQAEVESLAAAIINAGWKNREMWEYRSPEELYWLGPRPRDILNI